MKGKIDLINAFFIDADSKPNLERVVDKNEVFERKHRRRSA